MLFRSDRPVLTPRGDAAARPGYLEVSRGLAASIVFIMPLLVIYELGMLRLRSEGAGGGLRVAAEDERLSPGLIENPLEGDRNAIAAVVKGPLFVFGRRAMLVFNVLVGVALIGALMSLSHRRALRLRMFPVMVAESALYAAGVAFVVSFALRFPLSMPAVPTNFAGFWPKAVAAAGAGVYEELLFRGVLLAALYLVARNVLEMNRWVAAVLAIAAASALFSAAHFISGGEVSNWTAFRFRLVAGIALSVVFLARGLGIAAWSHAIYNVWIFSAPPP